MEDPNLANESSSTRRLTIPAAILKSIRLRQATKNLCVFAALVFAGDIAVPWMVARVAMAFVVLIFVSGSVYVLNDLLDVEQDRRHPTKCRRPIASGDLPVPVAWFTTVVLSLVGTAAAFALAPSFGLVALAYLVLQISYCFWLKRVVLLDVFVIATGFVLRTVAGALVIHVFISHWLILCTLQLALFLGFGKRRQEIVLLGSGAGKHRAILDEYSLPFLDQMIAAVAMVAIVCYSVYSIESITARQHPHLWATVPIVMYAVFRYFYLVYQRGWGGAPDEVLLQDRSLQVAILVWFGLVLLLFAFDTPVGIAFMRR